MNRSESLGELAKALAKAQGEVEPAEKDTTNDFFKSDYADLASVLRACDKAMSANGLSLLQMPLVVDGADSIPYRAGVENLLLHVSGEWVGSSLVLPLLKRDAQGIGSAITYARRYSLLGIMRIRCEDDDGNAACAPPIQAVKPAASTSANGTPKPAPAKLIQPPPVVSRVHNFEQRLVSRGLCEGGELLAWITDYCGSGWATAPVEDVQQACREFESLCKEALQPDRQPRTAYETEEDYVA